jgi:hypothetical protein
MYETIKIQSNTTEEYEDLDKNVLFFIESSQKLLKNVK